MITFHLEQTKYQSALQDVFVAFPGHVAPFVNVLDLTFGLGGLTRCSHTALIYILATQYNYPGAKMIEIGSFNGHTTATLSWGAPKATVIAVEPEPNYASLIKDNLNKANVYGFATPYENIQVRCMTSMQAFEEYKDDLFDLVFIDGDHLIGVKDDIAWWERLKTNGLILFHDYYPLFPSVIETVQHLAMQTGKPLDIALMPDGGLVGLYK